jgi:hypothetical protein
VSKFNSKPQSGGTIGEGAGELGTGDGTSLGTGVGGGVGWEVGSRVGTGVGGGVGLGVGLGVGGGVGSGVGLGVGGGVGSGVGLGDGSSVMVKPAEDGWGEGIMVGEQIGGEPSGASPNIGLSGRHSKAQHSGHPMPVGAGNILQSVLLTRGSVQLNGREASS